MAFRAWVTASLVLETHGAATLGQLVMGLGGVGCWSAAGGITALEPFGVRSMTSASEPHNCVFDFP